MNIRVYLTGFWILVFTAPSFSVDKAGSPIPKNKKAESQPAPLVLPWTPDEVPEALVPFDQAARTGDEVDLVLNILELAYGAHHLNNLDLAKKAYDCALDRIDTIDAKSKTAARARSLFVSEEEKTFKGEPYERSMAFFYRGVLAAQGKDYELARACFRSASFYDSNSAQHYEGDYVIHYWMEAKMDQLLGQSDRAQEVFRWAAESAEIADLSPHPIPGTDPSANTILIIESGSSPVKVGLGPYASLLAFDPPMSAPPEGGIAINLGTQELARLARPTENILAQARSRGRRMADRINSSKASFKSFSDALGTGALIGGGIIASQASNTDQGIAGGLLMLGGLLAKGISQATNPKADLRMWSSLPTHIYLVPATLDGAADLEVCALDSSGSPTSAMTVKVAPGSAKEPGFLLILLR